MTADKQDSGRLQYLEIDFAPSFPRFAKRVRLDLLPELEDEAEAFFSLVKSRLVPKAVYRPAFIDQRTAGAEKERNGSMHICIEQTAFYGKVLSVLDGIHRVFPYIATCGTEMENAEEMTKFDSMLAPHWLDELKMQALGSIRRTLFDTIRKQYGLDALSSVNPGSGNTDIWPVEELQKLFPLLENGALTGVQLTESSLMQPNKSIAGFAFSPEIPFESCACCERRNCPDRRVPYQYSL